jgi:hypothetical protein
MKKIIYALMIVGIAGFLAIAIGGCSKGATENKLSGRWSRVYVDNLDNPGLVEEWEFTGDSELRIYNHHATPTDTNYSVGKYSMKSYREFTVSGDGEDGFPQDANGNWRIVKLKKGSLIVVREEGGLTFREFEQL